MHGTSQVLHTCGLFKKCIKRHTTYHTDRYLLKSHTHTYSCPYFRYQLAAQCRGRNKGEREEEEEEREEEDEEEGRNEEEITADELVGFRF